LSITAIIVCIISPALASSGFLVKNGVTPYKIVLTANPAPAEKTAALELTEYLGKISGVKLLTVASDEIQQGPNIYIGRNPKLPADLSKLAAASLAEEEILISTGKDGSILLCGGSPRGTLYAVYEYLYRLGVRFYTPDYTKLPAPTKSIPLPSYYRYCPPAYARSMSLGNDAPPEWYAHNRLNSIALWGDLPVEYGSGKPEGPDMHTFWRYVPVGVFDEQPNWAAMQNGKRLPPAGNSNWGMCLRPEVRSYLADRAVEWSDRHPGYSTIWMGINDGSPFCTCDYCTEFYKQHGGKPSSLVVQLINELAERLPNKLIKTLAYGWSMDPPENMKMRSNTVVMFCAQADPHTSIPKGKSAAVLTKRLNGWKRVAKKISVYLYPYPTDNYWFPSPSFYPGAESISWASANGISELYAQISGFGGSHGSESLDLRAWVYSRMMWDPKSDARALVKEFCHDNYSVAAEDVIKVIDMLHSKAWAKSAASTKHSFVVPAYVDPIGVHKANNILEKAYARFSKNDADAKDRFETFWIAYLWADVWSGFESIGKYDDTSSTWSVPMTDGNLRNRYAVLVKSLMIKHRANGLSDLVRLNPCDLSIDKYGKEWPAVKISDPKTSLVVVPGISGNIVEFQDVISKFAPLKEAWFYTILQYPLFAAWREQVGGQYVPGYEITGKGTNWVEMKGTVAGSAVDKRVSISGGTVTATVSYSGNSNILSTIMMDMNDEVFGTSPVVYVLRSDNSWSRSMPNDGLGDFWYSSRPVDLTGAVGKLAIVDSKETKGVMFEWKPDESESITVEYDSYVHPANLGKMLQLISGSRSGLPLTIKASILNTSDEFPWKSRK